MTALGPRAILFYFEGGQMTAEHAPHSGPHVPDRVQNKRVNPSPGLVSHSRERCTIPSKATLTISSSYFAFEII